jgi:arylsulfatase
MWWTNMQRKPQQLIAPIATMAIAFLLSLICIANAIAQEALPPLIDQPFKGKIGLTDKDSTPSFPSMKLPPKGAPNVLLILLDDVGFGNPSTFGGPIETPTLERLAKGGLRYNNFHVTALCSPTRAALLTGRNHHAAGTAIVMESATGYPGYDGVLPKSTATVAEILRLSGYSTAAFGKWHQVPMWESSVAGPFDHWATGEGFEYFYGFVGGMTQQFTPNLFENTTAIEPYLHDKNYYLTTAMADKAITWIRYQHAVAPQKPFFLYFAPGAAHAPHQVPKEWSDKYQGKFDAGWDVYRQATFERQKRLGVIPSDAKLTPWPDRVPRWDSLSPDQKRLYARMMEVYAGFLTEADHEVGRVVDAINQIGGLDNTLVIYIAGDNGASPEGGLGGTVNEDRFLNGMADNVQQELQKIDQLGGPYTFSNYPVGWAWASNTPFRWTKQVASHLGGITDGAVISWPGRIKATGGLRSQFHHVIDITPTILEAAGIPQPSMVNGVAQKPFNGVSMIYTFDHPEAPSRHTTQYFEMEGNHAIYHDQWMASCLARIPWEPKPLWPSILDCKWELYDLSKDYSQAVDLAPDYPDRVTALKDLFFAEAARNDVLPLDDRPLLLRFAGQPNYADGRTEFTFYPGTIRLPEYNAPNIMNRSFSIKAIVDIPSSGAEGTLVTEGGRFGGYGLFVQGGKLVYVYNFADNARYVITSTEAVPAGKATLEFRFSSDGKIGSGGNGKLFINGKSAGEGRIERTESVMFSDDETFDVGLDTGTPVAETYQVPFAFTGVIEKVEFKLGKGARIGQDATARAVERVE